MAIFLAFGIAFEVPVAIILLCWTGAASVASLKEKRPYIIVGAFVVGMLLTPPDIISQTLLAVPMCLLFEIGLFFAKFYTRTSPAPASDESPS
jgi:sec-independent protein translocase protein TatC